MTIAKELPKLTLLVLSYDNKILLGLKKRGFGKGKYTGFGGKTEENESLIDCMCRETHEEAGIVLDKSALELVAINDFFFPHKPSWDMQVHVYKASSFIDIPVETEEMIPKEFSLSSIPFDQMWSDSKHWLQKVLDGKKIRGFFTFNEDVSVKDFSVNVVDELNDE